MGATTKCPIGDCASEKPVLSRLTASNRLDLQDHLLSLEDKDRKLRFGGCVADRTVRGYIHAIDFRADAVFGVFDEQLKLIAAAHLGRLPSRPGQPNTAEVGLSVAASYRRRRIGAALLERATQHCQNAGITRLYLHYQISNNAMARLAQRAGMKITALQGEADAYLAIKGATPASLLAEWMADQKAAVDHAMKRQRVDMARLLGLWWAVPTARAKATTLALI